MNSRESGQNRLELSTAKIRAWLTVAALGVVLLLSSCGPTEANSDPLSGAGVVHAYGAESFDAEGFHYGPNSGQFDVRPSGGGILESSLVKRSTLCDSDLTRSQIELCNSLESLANVMGMSEAERSDLRGRFFVVDAPTMESIQGSNATGFAIPEYQGGQIVGKGVVAFPDYISHDLSGVAHEWGHALKYEGLHNLNKTHVTNRLTLGSENVEEDLSCVQIVDETATICKEVEPGRASCGSSTLTELRADMFATIITSRVAGCTAANWDPLVCGPGEYSGYLWETSDGGMLTRAETATLMQTMRNYYLTNPAEFDAWVKMQREGQFTQSWQAAINAFGLSGLTPEEAVYKLMFLDSSINFYSLSTGNTITYTDQPSVQAFCEQ